MIEQPLCDRLVCWEFASAVGYRSNDAFPAARLLLPFGLICPSRRGTIDSVAANAMIGAYSHEVLKLLMPGNEELHADHDDT